MLFSRAWEGDIILMFFVNPNSFGITCSCMHWDKNSLWCCTLINCMRAICTSWAVGGVWGELWWGWWGCGEGWEGDCWGEDNRGSGSSYYAKKQMDPPHISIAVSLGTGVHPDKNMGDIDVFGKKFFNLKKIVKHVKHLIEVLRNAVSCPHFLLITDNWVCTMTAMVLSIFLMIDYVTNC